MTVSYALWRLDAGRLGVPMLVDPPVVVVYPRTRGFWVDRPLAEEVRRDWLPPTASESPTLRVLDLNSVWPSSDVLTDLLVPAGQAVRAGGHGFVALQVAAGNVGLRRLIEALATQEQLPLYISWSAAPKQVAEAVPAGDLTATERETLDTVVSMGGRVAASDLARRLDLNSTAAGNRLVKLVAKGYLRRQSRPGRGGDLFIDPRFASPAQSLEGVLAAARDALPPEALAATEQLLRRAADEVDAEPASLPSSSAVGAR
ncbi:MAG: helix-turn-helix domain-containing protein [Candidatus Dormibacteria bacterium]